MSSEGCLRLSRSNIIKFLQDISLHNKYANEHQSCLPDIFNIIAEILHCAKMLSVICCRSLQIFLKVPLSSVLCPQLCWLWLVIVRVNWLTIYLSNLYHVVIMTVPGSCCLLNYCYEPSFSLLISDPCMNTRFAFLGADFYEQFKCNKLPGLPGPDTRLGTLNISRITPGVVIFRPLMSPRRGSVMILRLMWTALPGSWRAHELA